MEEVKSPSDMSKWNFIVQLWEKKNRRLPNPHIDLRTGLLHATAVDSRSFTLFFTFFNVFCSQTIHFLVYQDLNINDN